MAFKASSTTKKKKVDTDSAYFPSFYHIVFQLFLFLWKTCSTKLFITATIATATAGLITPTACIL